MNSNGFIAFMVAVGAGVYVGNYFYKTTGGNTVRASVAGTTVGIFVFLVGWYLLSLIPG